MSASTEKKLRQASGEAGTDKKAIAAAEEAEKKAKSIIDNAESEKQQKIKAADECWKNLSTKLEAFYQSHVGLRELLSVQSGKKTSESK